MGKGNARRLAAFSLLAVVAFGACVEPPRDVRPLLLDEPSWTAERVRATMIAHLIQAESEGNDARARELLSRVVRGSKDWDVDYGARGVWQVRDGRIGRAAREVPAPTFTPIPCTDAGVNTRCNVSPTERGEELTANVWTQYPGQFFREGDAWMEWGPAQGVFNVYEASGQVVPANAAAATFLTCFADYDLNVCTTKAANVAPRLCIDTPGGLVRLRPPRSQHDTPYLIQDGFCEM